MTASVALVVEQLRRRVPGGIGRYATGLLDGLAACRPRPSITLVASRAPGRHPTAGRGGDPLDAWGFPVRTVGLPGPLLTRAWDRGLLAVRGDFAVVHTLALAAPPRGRSKAARVVTVHDLAWRRFPEATTPRGRRWHERALRRVLEDADALVVPSARVAEQLHATATSPPPISVVTWGSDHLPAPDHDGARRLLDRLGVRGPYLLSASTLEPRKNLVRLAEAHRMALDALPEPWPLVVAGPEGWGSAATPPAEAAGGVVLAGRVDDAVLAALYARARAFAYVPLDEGYGLPPVEAMAAGTPVLASTAVPSAVPGPGEEPPALLVDPLAASEIAAGLVRVALDDELRRRLTAAGRVLAAGRTWRRTADRHLELWEALA